MCSYIMPISQKSFLRKEIGLMYEHIEFYRLDMSADSIGYIPLSNIHLICFLYFERSGCEDK